MRTFIRARAAALLAGLSLPGCFAVADVDRFHSTAAGPAPDSSAKLTASDQFTNFKFTLVGMVPHVNQMVEFRIIDSNNFIQFRGVVNPLGGPDATINVPLAIPTLNGPFHLDFYADVNGSGGYDGLGSVVSNDHAWRIDPLADYPAGAVAPVPGLVQVTFTHNTSFTDINTYPSGTPNPPKDTTLDATVHVTGASALQGNLIQVRIVDTGSNRTVGLYRIPQITQSSFSMKVPGMVENGADYDVLVYVDANGNGKYDNPSTGGGDLGWSLVGTADVNGLDVSLDAETPTGANTDVGAP